VAEAPRPATALRPMRSQLGGLNRCALPRRALAPLPRRQLEGDARVGACREDDLLKEIGVDAAKDVLTVQEYHRLRNHLEDKYTKVRVPSAKFAETILK